MRKVLALLLVVGFLLGTCAGAEASEEVQPETAIADELSQPGYTSSALCSDGEGGGGGPPIPG